MRAVRGRLIEVLSRLPIARLTVLITTSSGKTNRTTTRDDGSFALLVDSTEVLTLRVQGDRDGHPEFYHYAEPLSPIGTDTIELPDIEMIRRYVDPSTGEDLLDALHRGASLLVGVNSWRWQRLPISVEVPSAFPFRIGVPVMRAIASWNAGVKKWWPRDSPALFRIENSPKERADIEVVVRDLSDDGSPIDRGEFVFTEVSAAYPVHAELRLCSWLLAHSAERVALHELSHFDGMPDCWAGAASRASKPPEVRQLTQLLAAVANTVLESQQPQVGNHPAQVLEQFEVAFVDAWRQGDRSCCAKVLIDLAATYAAFGEFEYAEACLADAQILSATAQAHQL